MNCKEFQKLPIDEQRRILADEAKEFVERELPADWEVKLEAYRDAEVSRLTDCLEETIDELLCGNRIHAQLTDRQNDAAAFLDSANQTINRLREELKAAYDEIQYHINRYQAAEQDRLQVEAERDAALMNMSEANRRTGYAEQKLTKAEEALKQARMDITYDSLEEAEVGIYGLSLDTVNSIDQVLLSGGIDPRTLPSSPHSGKALFKTEAALQPEGEPK